MVCDFVFVKYLRWLFILEKEKRKKKEDKKEGKKMFKVAVEKSAVLCCANHSWTDCIALTD